LDTGTLGNEFDILIVGVQRKVVLALPGVIFAHLEQMIQIRLRGLLEGDLGERIIEIAHTTGKTLNYLHGNRSVALDKKRVLVAMDGYERYIGQCLGGFYVAVRAHSGYDAEEVSRRQDTATLLFHDFHFFTDPDLSGPDYVEVIRVLFSFNNDIGTFVEVYE
jgi:hypothetical protein